MNKTMRIWVINISLIVSLTSCSTTTQIRTPATISSHHASMGKSIETDKVKNEHNIPNQSFASKGSVALKDSALEKETVTGKNPELSQNQNKEPPQSQIKSWRINGKIAVQTPRQSGTATVNWTQRSNQYYMSMMGPAGVGALNLYGRPGKVILQTSNGKTFADRSPEHLLAKGWGYNLPVSHMKYWVRGLPSPDLSMSTRYDSKGRLRTLIQQGWVIQYLGYTHRGKFDLPNKIFIHSPALQVKIVIYNWQV